MEYLYQGVQKYKSNTYPNRKELLNKLNKGQTPSSLIITCSDSRIVVNEFTHTDPGDVFVIRNAGNLIGPYTPDSPSNEALSLEYAVEVLGVKEIVICGHSHCGAMQASQQLETLHAPPLIYNGIKNIIKQFKDIDYKNISLDQLILENVKIQLLNLYTYPCVKRRYEEKNLFIWGWHYDFCSGDIKQRISLQNLL